MLCTSAVYASGVYTITDADTINVADSSTIKISESADVYNQLSREGYAAPNGDSNPNAILKSGNGALVIDQDVTMNNPFVIDQGEVEINNATVTSERSYANATSCLSIGEAKLTLDNGHFTQTGAGVYAICVGNRDGAATLELNNGSTMSTKHFVFAGYTGSQATDYRVGIDAAGAENVATSTININSGSKLTAGTSLQFANVNVNIDGAGSVLADNGTGSKGNQWPESYFGYGYERNVEINVTNGGKLDLNWDAYTATGYDSKVVINVSGKDAYTKTASSIDVAGVLHLSTKDDYDDSTSYGSNYGASTELNITDGAKANISRLVMGQDAGQASVNVGKSSTYSGKEITVGVNGSLSNDGTVTLSSGNVTEWTTNGGSTYGSQTVSKEGTLNIVGGSVTNNNTMTVNVLNMSSGTAANDQTGSTTQNATLVHTSGNLKVEKKGNLTDASFTATGGTVRFGSQYNGSGELSIKDSTFTSDGSTVYVHCSATSDNSTINIKKSGSQIRFEKDLTATDTKLNLVEGSVTFSGNLNLNGGNEFKVDSTLNRSFGLAKGKTLTSNGDNSIIGGFTMGTDSAIVVESGTLNIKSDTYVKPDGSVLNNRMLSITNVYTDSDAEVNVTADRGFLKITGDATISNLTINGASTADSNGSYLSGDIKVTDSLVVNANPKSELTHEFTGSLNLMDTTTVSVASGASVLLHEVAVTATTADPQMAVLDNLLSAANVTLSDDAAITVGLSQELINSIADSQNGMEPFGFQLTLLSDAVSAEYNKAELDSLLGNVTFDFTGLTNPQGYEVEYDDATQSYVLKATASIPEPTTATLSLLALAALAARRRRCK